MCGESQYDNKIPIDLQLSTDELDAVREHIIGFIKGQVEVAGVDGAVIGLSGGVDSSLTAFLAVEALGSDQVHGLILPSEVNREENMNDAERVAEELGIEYDTIAIAPIVDMFLDAYPEGRDDTVAVGNVRVRLRSVLTYFVANHETRLVLGTGNRSEALTGYFTKYGDQAVDCNPIGTLYKQHVRQLAQHVGVPDRIVKKPPSAEMWIGQTDEDELGLAYETLDMVLALHIDGPLSRAATIRSLNVDGTVVDRVVDLYEESCHKRQMPPAPDPL